MVLLVVLLKITKLNLNVVSIKKLCVVLVGLIDPPDLLSPGRRTVAGPRQPRLHSSPSKRPDLEEISLDVRASSMNPWSTSRRLPLSKPNSHLQDYNHHLDCIIAYFTMDLLQYIAWASKPKVSTCQDDALMVCIESLSATLLSRWATCGSWTFRRSCLERRCLIAAHLWKFWC
jgi:hypothetical protein